MTLTNMEYITRDDDTDLNEFLEINHNEHMVFIDCRFSLCTNKIIRNSSFVNCIFDHVTKETYFVNCTFDAPTFYAGFHGTLQDCNITNYTGKISELKEKES